MDEALIRELRNMLESNGFKILGKEFLGRAGVRHTFTLVAKIDDVLSAFELLDEVGENEVLGNRAKQIDTGLRVCLIYTKAVTEDARRLAKMYSMRLIPWHGLHRSALRMYRDEG